ncbi:protein adenylyltransferase SelO [Actinomarinicola tropica]|uniref:Protein nucleotidyltransferase YdiU n=1 Tax=Actinomarinicola tropica TaxID=2789776 RepID=A0A5Q2RLY4_9ACTN|nr:YdiU family protein [Actinomarinicola tropica]QGG94205.1 YdiU family protein [Actinomarinicola tropica]
MTTTTSWPFAADATFADQLDGLYVPWEPDQVPAPRLLALNEDLATELRLDPTSLLEREGVDVLVGNAIPAGAVPVAQAYAGHQFGGYSPRLGDGRAVLLGEVIDREGRRRDLHLKGSGRTPFARGGDGKAAVGPMLRELVMGEAMHRLGIPTTRALAVVATGEQVARETALPGAVLCRVAASHLRVGTFQFAAATGDEALLRRLLTYAIERHHPHAADTDRPALALFEAVVAVQASLVARWMAVGFIHGVMNTDNTTISGETIDYGPCAFMEAHDPATVFSSIDHGGRYAYGNQPAITAWNLARLAETLLPLIDDDQDTAVAAATAALEGFAERFRAEHRSLMRAKLGLDAADASVDDDAVDELAAELVALMQEHRADHTSAFRSLSDAARGDVARTLALLDEAPEAQQWLDRWSAHLGDDRASVGAAMDATNPVYIPRNHLVEEALDAATSGDLAPTGQLLAVLADPFTARPGLERYAEPAPDDFGPYRTFCGT